jgi:hypothetical protein
MLSSLILISGVLAQSNVINLEPVSVEDLKAIDQCFQEREAMQGLISEQAGEITDLNERLDTEKNTSVLNDRELKLKDDQLKLKDEEIRIYKEYGDKMKDIADKAIQLEEKAQKRTFWEKLGVVGLAIAAVVFAFAH